MEILLRVKIVRNCLVGVRIIINYSFTIAIINRDILHGVYRISIFRELWSFCANRPLFYAHAPLQQFAKKLRYAPCNNHSQSFEVSYLYLPNIFNYCELIAL